MTDTRQVLEEARMKYTYPKCWDEPYSPPESLQGELRELMVEAHRRTLAMSPNEKQAMYDAQRESFIRAMGPCEHGDYDWETCSQCLQKYHGTRP